MVVLDSNRGGGEDREGLAHSGDRHGRVQAHAGRQAHARNHSGTADRPGEACCAEEIAFATGGTPPGVTGGLAPAQAVLVVWGPSRAGSERCMTLRRDEAGLRRPARAGRVTEGVPDPGGVNS